MSNGDGWARPPKIHRPAGVPAIVPEMRDGWQRGSDDAAASKTAGDGPAGTWILGWLGRHRDLVARGRDMAHVVMPLAPPPMRVPLIAASLAAEGLLIVDDYRQRRLPRGEAGWRGIGVVLDGVGLAAASSIAPAGLARRARAIGLVRVAYARVDRARGASTR